MIRVAAVTAFSLLFASTTFAQTSGDYGDGWNLPTSNDVVVPKTLILETYSACKASGDAYLPAVQQARQLEANANLRVYAAYWYRSAAYQQAAFANSYAAYAILNKRVITPDELSAATRYLQAADQLSRLAVEQAKLGSQPLGMKNTAYQLASTASSANRTASLHAIELLVIVIDPGMI